MQENYRDINIWYNEHMERFECEIETNSRYSNSLKTIKSAIDKLLDGETQLKKKFDKLDVYKEYHNCEYKLITVTSITDDGECWVTGNSNYRKREKLYRSDSTNLILKTKDNEDKIDVIKSKKEAIGIIQEEINEIVKSFERINIEELQKQVQDS